VIPFQEQDAMRPTKFFSVFTRARRRVPARVRPARQSRLAAAERLEDRLNLAATVIDLAAPRPASDGYPALDSLPIPAGATLVDVCDIGRYVLFSSTDTNLIPGQQTIPSLNPNLFWLDTQEGVTRLVTHRAGSAVQSTGYAGLEGNSYAPGYGLWPMFEPLTADLSGDGKSVVFDSIIAANEYDASVPVENDQATYRPLKKDATSGSQWNNFQIGTVDVFVWRADGDAANNISLVSRLNATGRQEAVTSNQLVPGLPAPNPGQPMATGVFAQEFLPLFPGSFRNFVQQQPVESLTLNKGVSDDGTRVLYDSWVPAGWIDTLNPEIRDQQNPGNGQSRATSEWTLDSFVASTRGFGGSGAVGEWSARTVSINFDGTQALGLYTGPQQLGRSGAQLFEPMFSQISGDGSRVVYSTRRTSPEVVADTTDSDFSSDVFTNHVDSRTNLLVSRRWEVVTQAAGSAQPNFFSGGVNPFARGFVGQFWDSQNHSISDDGRTVAFTSSAGNLVQGWKNVSADLADPVVVGTQTWSAYQANPIDIYGFQFTSADPTVSTGKAALVNSPDGLANTNRIANFAGMSADGSTFKFATAANNFYQPGFTSPYPFTQNLPQAPLPLGFILGGFSNLWVRKINWAAAATGTTSLVSAGFAVDADGNPDVTGRPNASGNKATPGSPTPAGARDVLNAISENGRFVMFSSTANNLAEGVYDRAFKGGVFVRDLQTGRTTLLTTTATGNVPSAGLFTNFALATTEDLTAPSPRFAAYVDGTGANDMQTRFRTEDMAPGPTSHVYQIEYPVVSQAASATNPAIFTVSGVGVNARPVLEFRNPGVDDPVVRTSPGQLLPNYFGEWRTATGDINADGVVDYVYGAGLGGGDTVIVVDGARNSVIWQVAGMFPLVSGATGAAARPGVFVATADVNCDGFADVIVGSDGRRSGELHVYNGRRGTLLQSFQPFGLGAKRVGVRVAGGDVDGDGYGDVVVGRGPGGRATVEVYSGRIMTVAAKDGNWPWQQPQTALLNSFTVQGGNGVYVAAADMNRNGLAEVVVGFDRAQTVSIYDGLQGTLVSTRNLGPAFRGGVRVAARAGQVMVASGPGTSPTIQLFAYANGVADPWTQRASLVNEKIRGFSSRNTRGLFVG
jgi:hypothetical protein